jgi:hypothetical protein
MVQIGTATSGPLLQTTVTGFRNVASRSSKASAGRVEPTAGKQDSILQRESTWRP